MEFPVLSREQVRRVDRIAMEKYGISGVVLMENAGRGVVDLLRGEGIGGPVAICCGKGNNAGDGFVIARHLELGGFEASVLLWADPEELRGDAKVNFDILKHTNVPIISAGDSPQLVEDTLSAADWILDALLGTGATGEPRPPFDAAISQINAADGRKLAVDVPSGLDCDNGTAASCCVKADITASFVAAKPGFFKNDGPEKVGRLHVLQIGAPMTILEELDEIAS